MNHLIVVNIFIFALIFSSLLVFKKHYLILIIYFELLVSCLVLLFASVTLFYNDLTGQIFGLIVLTVSASESAVLLSLVTFFYKKKQEDNVGDSVSPRYL